jgi:hypothetical protein
MVSQVAAISLVLLSVDFPVYEVAARVCLWGAMVFSLLSAASYFRQFWHKVDESVKARRRIELLQLEGERRKAAMRSTGEKSPL